MGGGGNDAGNMKRTHRAGRSQQLLAPAQASPSSPRAKNTQGWGWGIVGVGRGQRGGYSYLKGDRDSPRGTPVGFGA